MESRICLGLYFAGEILDIDGITGGFNFQHAWTTGWIAKETRVFNLILYDGENLILEFEVYMHPLVKNFWEQVLQGNLLGAVQKLIPTLESSYDQSSEIKHLINFVDAAIFDSAPEAYLQYQILESLGQIPSLVN